jgi:hypothetical protein
MKKIKSSRRAERVLDDDRRIDWLIGRGVQRTSFEAKLASWAAIMPSLDGVQLILRLAWHPMGRPLLLAALLEARRRPGRDGLAAALKSTRRIWRDVWIEPPRPKGGRPTKWGDRVFNVWLLFHSALGRARELDPKKTISAMKREFVERSKRGKGYWHNDTWATGHNGSKTVPVDAVKLKSVAQLDSLLKAFERRLSPERRAQTLRHVLPRYAELLLAPPKRGRPRRSQKN